MSVLSDADHDLLELYLGRILELHANGVVTRELAVAELAHVMGGADFQNEGIVDHMRAFLETAWDQRDA